MPAVARRLAMLGDAPLPARSKYIFWAGSPLFMLKPSFDGGVQL